MGPFLPGPEPRPTPWCCWQHAGQPPGARAGLDTPSLPRSLFIYIPFAGTLHRLLSHASSRHPALAQGQRSAPSPRLRPPPAPRGLPHRWGKLPRFPLVCGPPRPCPENGQWPSPASHRAKGSHSFLKPLPRPRLLTGTGTHAQGLTPGGPHAQCQAHLCPGLRLGDGSLLPGSWRLPSRLSHGWVFPLPLSQENPDPHKNCSDSCSPHAHPVETQPAPEQPLVGPAAG